MRRRIKNDYRFVWHITRGGKPADFAGKPMSVQLLDAMGRQSDISYTIEGNTVTVTFLGRDQRRLGKYNAVLCLYPGEPGMATVNHQEVVELVAHTEEEDQLSAENVEIIAEEFTDNITVSQRGLSAYEVAVANGFKGSVNEWLASLKGAQGDPGLDGKDGCCLYPKFSVNSEMRLILDTDFETNQITLEKGHLILNL